MKLSFGFFLFGEVYIGCGLRRLFLKAPLANKKDHFPHKDSHKETEISHKKTRLPHKKTEIPHKKTNISYKRL